MKKQPPHLLIASSSGPRDDEIEKQLASALSEDGVVFPCTIKDVLLFEARFRTEIEKQRTSIPSPEETLNRGSSPENAKLLRRFFSAVQGCKGFKEEPVVLARAARNLDGEISHEIEAKMRADRLRAASKFK